jgi:hypothetical protein
VHEFDQAYTALGMVQKLGGATNGRRPTRAMCAAGLHVATMLHGLNTPAALVAGVRVVTCLVCSEELEQQGRQALCVWLASHSTIVQGSSI